MSTGARQLVAVVGIERNRRPKYLYKVRAAQRTLLGDRTHSGKLSALNSTDRAH